MKNYSPDVSSSRKPLKVHCLFWVLSCWQVLQCLQMLKKLHQTVVRDVPLLVLVALQHVHVHAQAVLMDAQEVVTQPAILGATAK